MNEKIQIKLQEYGFTLADLSKEELSQLKKEIEAEDKGMKIIDGVLSFKSPYKKNI